MLGFHYLKNRSLTDLTGLTPSDGSFIVGDGGKWVAESGATARTSIGLGTGNSPAFTGLDLTGITDGYIPYLATGALAASPIFTDGTNIGIGDPAPGYRVEITGDDTYFALHNSANEDTLGGRESRIIFRGHQSGGEESSLGQIEGSHDGGGDNQCGKMIFSTNGGSGLVQRFEMDSQNNFIVHGSLAVDSGATVPTFLAASGATTGANYITSSTTGGIFKAGIESSTGAAVFPGTSAYSIVIGTNLAYSFHVVTNNSVKATINSDGDTTLYRALTCGSNSTIQGSLMLWDGAGGNTPGYIAVGSPNGTVWYIFVEDDGTVKLHNAVPTANADGGAIGDQTD